MLVYNGGGGRGGTVVGNGVVVMVRGGGKLTNVVLRAKIYPHTEFQVYHTTMLSTYINIKYI